MRQDADQRLDTLIFELSEKVHQDLNRFSQYLQDIAHRFDAGPDDASFQLEGERARRGLGALAREEKVIQVGDLLDPQEIAVVLSDK
jgi:hypothetical protein